MNNSEHENAPKKRSTPKRLLKYLVLTFVVVAVLLAAAIIAGPALVSTAAVERIISQNTQEKLGRPAKLGDFSMKLAGGLKVVLSDFVIQDKEKYGDRPLVKVDKITLNADILPLLNKELIVNKLSIENPRVSVVKGKDGQLNINDLPAWEETVEKQETDEEAGETGATALGDLPAVKITSFTVTGGAIHFADLETDQSSHIGSLEAELAAEAHPASKTGEITTAKLSFDGFDATAEGKVRHENGRPVVKGFAVDCRADISKIGELSSPVLPVNVAGNIKYHLSADGPITAVKAGSELTLTNFRATGARLRKPANIESLVARQSSVLDLEKMSADEISNEVISNSLGVSGKLTGKIGNLAERSGLDLKLAGDIDIEKLTDFADSFTPQPLKASGQLTADSLIVGSIEKDMSVKGQVFAADLKLERPGPAKPYREARIDLIYDMTVHEGARLDIRKFELKSGLMTAEASGSMAPEAADLSASMAADLAAVGSALAGMGLVPQDLSVGGKFAASLRTRTVEGGMEVVAGSTIENFALASPQLGGGYAEPKIAFDASGVLGFVNGAPDSVRRSEFKLASKLMDLQGKLTADKLAAEPSLRCDVTMKTDLASVRGALIQLGKIEEGTRVGGKMQADITIATLDRRPLKKEARAPQKTRPFALAGGKRPPLAPFGAAAAARADAEKTALDRIVLAGSAAGKDVYYNEIKIDKFDSKLGSEDGKFSADATMHMGDGVVTLSDVTDLRTDQLRHDAKIKVKQVLLTKRLGEFLKKTIPILALPVGEITGVFDAYAELSAQGAESEQLFATMNGDGSLTMPEDMRVKIPAFTLLPLLSKFSSLGFGRMDSVFDIKNGLSSSETRFTSAGLAMKLTGTTDLVTRKVPKVKEPGRAINYTVSMSGKLLGRDLRRFLDDEGRLPVRITGTMEHPKAKLMLEGILGPLKGLFK